MVQPRKVLNHFNAMNRNCQICGNEFKPRTCQINRGLGHFCSKHCAMKFRNRDALNPAWGDKAKELYASGLGSKRISKMVGVKRGKVGNFLKRNDIIDPFRKNGGWVAHNRKTGVGESVNTLIMMGYRAEQRFAGKPDAAWAMHHEYRKWVARRLEAKKMLSTDYRIRGRVRTYIRDALAHSHQRINRTEQYIGCTIKQLRTHLESQFKPGMTWDNYGQGKGNSVWHIDHIIACNNWDLSNPEHRRLCFHYTNLQPEWSADNIRKSDSF